VRVRLPEHGIDTDIPAGHRRLVFAYLVWNRRRPVPREELRELLWPRDRPASADASLSAALSRLRRLVGPELLEGRKQLSLVLPPDTWIDLEAATAALERAEAAMSAGDWAAVLAETRTAREAFENRFLAGEKGAWVDDRRKQLEELRLEALKHEAVAGLELGGHGLMASERAARALIAAAPFREDGYRLLMELYSAQGNVAEALLVYEVLRSFLRDELGTTPATGVQNLHGRLLSGRPAGASAASSGSEAARAGAEARRPPGSPAVPSP
jgi:DNA-binding SARP family transcriptional activator